MKAKQKPLAVKTLDDFGVTLTARRKVLEVNEPAARKGGAKVPDVATLVSKLINEAKVIG